MFVEGERSLVTHMVPIGHGVWVACRFSSVLTLLDSNTMQPLQQVTIATSPSSLYSSSHFSSNIYLKVIYWKSI